MNRNTLILIACTLFLTTCKSDFVPKPRGYYRISFPEKHYQVFKSDCPFEFEYPTYGSIETPVEIASENCWHNISFPQYKAKIHLTYIALNNDLAKHSEDIRKLVYKHVVKANDIKEKRISDPKRKTYGIIYSITGNTASSLSFMLTDSVDNFLSGALYFSCEPNQDSLAPAIEFFSEDVLHLTKTLTWK